MTAKKVIWLQSGFRVLGLWYFLDGALSIGRRLTPGLFPGKFLSFGFPANLLLLLLGAALFLGARKLASSPRFSAGGDEEASYRWNEHPFLRALFFLAGVYLVFRIVPMLPAALSCIFRKLGYYEGPNTSGLLVFFSTGVLLILSWYFLRGAPRIRRFAAGVEEAFQAEGEAKPLSLGELLETLLRILGADFLVFGGVIMIQELWGWSRGYDSWAPFLAGLAWMVLGFLLLTRAGRVVPLVLKEDGPVMEGSSMPGSRAFLEAGFMVLGVWFLAGAVLGLAGPLGELVLGSGMKGSIYGSFWEAYGRHLVVAVLSLLLLFKARSLAGWCAGGGKAEEVSSAGPGRFSLETERRGFLAGGLLLGIFLLLEVVFSLPFLFFWGSSQWLLPLVFLVLALLVLLGAPYLARTFYPAGEDGGKEGISRPPLLDPALRVMGLWLLVMGLPALLVSAYTAFEKGAWRDMGPALFRDLFQAALGAFLLFGARRVTRLLPGGERSPAPALRGEGVL